MESIRVVEHDPKEFDVWEYDEIVFIDELCLNHISFVVLREDWDSAMEASNGVIYKALEKFNYFDAYVLVSPEYWEHYKTQALWQYNDEAAKYLSGIVEAWENEDTERIVRDAILECGFMYDLEGNVVPRLIHADLYDDVYDLADCISYIQENEELFGSFELLDAPYWSDSSKMLRVEFKPGDELGELLKAWLDGDEGYSPDSEYVLKHFLQFMNG